MNFDICVIGGGHAGIEAAHAGSVLGMKTALITMDASCIGKMSCNPAIGGVAKGQLVKEIDAIGGLMGLLADKAGIQYRMLNRSKGPAVWGPRAQMDMDVYVEAAVDYLKKLENLTILSATVAGLEPHSAEGYFLHLEAGEKIYARAVIAASGTFLNAVMYTGPQISRGGRVGEPSSDGLAEDLKNLGMDIIRLKTGTPARLLNSSIDYSKCIVQHGDDVPQPFSCYRGVPKLNNESVCWITHTNQATHEILRTGFADSPLFNGTITGIGPRYCPSIETKIERFSDKSSHQLFLEPEGLTSSRIYVNGFSSSLPADIQERALKSIPGLENCRILQIGYAVEYDAIKSSQLHVTYESRKHPNLYFAGQINGTSGYEEAAAQGIMAGVNAALKLKGGEPYILSRSEAYIGVLTDDLTSLDITEPYRMFTSRAEYRLFLRQDNAYERLTPGARKTGMISDSMYSEFEKSQRNKSRIVSMLENTKVTPDEINPLLKKKGSLPVHESERAMKLLMRPEISLSDLKNILNWEMDITPQERQLIESEVIYSGYFIRQKRDIDRTIKLAKLKIPPDFDYDSANAMRIEARQKLQSIRPLTVAAASSVSGVTPADISGLIFHINNGR